MTPTVVIAILIILFATALFYFKIADHFNIIDKPNHRSSHSTVTIRGGGIVFCIAAILFFLYSDLQYPYFILGLFLISFISFLDDLFTLNNKIRLSIHLIAVVLMFYQLQLFEQSWYWIPVATLLVIGTINAYNFMDGINGITGSYSLLILCTLYYINKEVVNFTSQNFLIVVGLSLIVFNFFNFRKKAMCFAGDVGSVSIAFILLFFIAQLVLKTGDFTYILLLLFYGLDTVTTIMFRLIRKENIFKAHRSHFYQFLANEKKWSHLSISTLYLFIQLIANIIVIFVLKNSMLLFLFFVLGAASLFLVVRFFFEGKKMLISK